MYRGLWLREAHSVVFYEILRLWEARFVRVLSVGEALGESDDGKRALTRAVR